MHPLSNPPPPPPPKTLRLSNVFMGERKGALETNGLSNKTTFFEKDRIVHKDKETAETMNKNFINKTKTLCLKDPKSITLMILTF